MSQMAHQAEAYPRFCGMKQLGVFLLSPWKGCYCNAGLPVPLASSSLVPIYTHTVGGEMRCESNECLAQEDKLM